MRVHVELHVEGDWWPLTPGRMMGGRERLGLRLARGFAASGHQVTLRGAGWSGTLDGVETISVGTSPPRSDVCVCIDAERPPDVRCARSIAWSHAAQWPCHLDGWDRVVAVSRYHADILRLHLGSEAPIDAIPAGCDLPPPSNRTRDRFLYASSPDRGLHRLLEMWPRLWQTFRIPLPIAYDVRGVVARRGRTGSLAPRLGEVARRLEQPGVIVHGPLEDDALARLRARSIALLYPLDPVLRDSELYALSVLEACAAGCPPILAAADAFPSVYREIARFAPVDDEEAWIAAARLIMEGGADEVERARAFAAARPWSPFHEAWEEVLRSTAALQAVPAAPTYQRWLVIAPGIGHGEAAYARVIADEGRALGHRVDVVTNHPSHIAVLGQADVHVDPTPATSIRLAQGGIDRIVYAAAAIAADSLAALVRVAPNVPMTSVEGSWPEAYERLPGVEALRGLLLALPPAVWKRGIEGPRPIFNVAPAISRRVIPVGWLPHLQAVRSPGLRHRVLCYFGVAATAELWELAPRLSIALEQLGQVAAVEGTYVCGRDDVGLPKWLRRRAVVSSEDFAAELDDADLVLCAPGAGTIGGARSRGIPVVAFTPGRVFDIEPECPGDRYAHALFLAGEVEIVVGPASAESIFRLLYRLIQEGRQVPSGDGVRQAASLIESMEPAPFAMRWRPPELRA